MTVVGKRPLFKNATDKYRVCHPGWRKERKKKEGGRFPIVMARPNVADEVSISISRLIVAAKMEAVESEIIAIVVSISSVPPTMAVAVAGVTRLEIEMTFHSSGNSCSSPQAKRTKDNFSDAVNSAKSMEPMERQLKDTVGAQEIRATLQISCRLDELKQCTVIGSPSTLGHFLLI
jgi:hypothetical protein